MDAPARAVPAGAQAERARDEGEPAQDWARSIPPAPFVVRPTDGSPIRFPPLSPRVAVLIGGGVVVSWLLWLALDSIRSFIVGLLLVYLLDIPVRWLVRRGVRRTLAIVIVYVVAVVAIVEALSLTLSPLIDELVRFVQDLPRIAESLNTRLAELSQAYSRLQLPEAVRAWVDELIAGAGSGGGLDITTLLPIVSGAGGFIASLFGYLLLPVWVFYLLKDRVVLVDALERAVPPSWRFDTFLSLRLVERVFGQWVRAQLVLGLSVGVLTFVGLLILSRAVDPLFGRYAVLLSLTAGVLELLPIIGPIISAVPAVLLAATAGIEPVIAALVLYTLVQQLENNILVPKIQGDAVQLHPAAVMMAIVIGGALAGLLGAILALPVAAAIRDVVVYLFRRAGPDDPSRLADVVERVGMRPYLSRLGSLREAPGG